MLNVLPSMYVLADFDRITRSSQVFNYSLHIDNTYVVSIRQCSAIFGREMIYWFDDSECHNISSKCTHTDWFKLCLVQIIIKIIVR